jgi:hypothetical protein
MEEKAMKIRKSLCLTAKKMENKEEKQPIKMTKVEMFFPFIWLQMIKRGFTFCKVLKRALATQFKLPITYGNQKRKGKTPSFNNKLKRLKVSQ